MTIVDGANDGKDSDLVTLNPVIADTQPSQIASNIYHTVPHNDNNHDSAQSNVNTERSSGLNASQGVDWIIPSVNPQLNMLERRPGPEWIYPTGNNIDDGVDVSMQGVIREGERHVPYQGIDYIVDPADTVTLPVDYTVDGEVVPSKNCFLRVCGFTIFDDAFPFKLNPKLRPILVAVISLAIAATVLSEVYANKFRSTTLNISISDELNLMTSMSPSYSPSDKPSNIPSNEPVDVRVVNITKVLLNISGDAIFNHDSAQSKAFRWIVEEDGMNLTFSSPNLVQRYALMVLYHSLLGEEWIRNHGYGSDIHECEWFGISCYSNGLAKGIQANRNNIRGQLPTEIGTLTGLKIFRLDMNFLSGSIPSEVGKLHKLTVLRLEINFLSGSIPHEIGDCKALHELYLGQNNKLTGTIPSSIGNLEFLQKLFIISNKLSGTIPSEVYRLSHLMFINLKENELTGSIPTELSLLTSLTKLNFAQNRLVGTLPSSFINLDSIQELRLSDNLLTGTIPSNLDLDSKLTRFDITNNLLSGTIPESIGSMSKIQFLLFSGNNIEGAIPSEIGKLNFLLELELHHNSLIGSVPSEVCGLSIIQLTTDCANSTTGIVCSCCTLCY